MDNAPEKKYDESVFVTSESLTMVDPDAVKTASPFKDLFPVRPNELKKLEESMKIDGYDKAHPIILWGGHDLVVVDGHTRLAAAQKLMFPRIPAIRKNFKDEAEALEYAIKSQVNRRNLSDAELLNCVTELDKRMSEGRPRKTVQSEAVSGRSSMRTADLLGTSRHKVEKIRAINDHGTDEVKDAVKAGKLSVNKAYNETMEARRDSQFKDEADLMTARQTALQDSICGMILARIEREKKKYPDAPFSEEACRTMQNAIINTIKNSFKTLTQKGN
jgi:ParB family chromosome partitioning protein